MSCTNNLRQFGLGLAMYADNANDRLPPAAFNPERDPGSGPWQSYTLYTGTGSRAAGLKTPYNLGYLHAEKFISSPASFYDPGLRHSAQLPIKFEQKYFQSATVPGQTHLKVE